MDQRKPTKDERDFVWVVKAASALGLGLMAAFLYSLKQVHPSIRLEITVGTGIAFLGTAVFTWLFCGILFKGEFNEDGSEQAAGRRKKQVTRWIIFFLTASTLATVGAFVYSLKDIAAESRRDVIQGTVIAVIVLTGGGVLIHKAVRFFEEQDKANLEQHEQEKKDED